MTDMVRLEHGNPSAVPERCKTPDQRLLVAYFQMQEIMTALDALQCTAQAMLKQMDEQEQGYLARQISNVADLMLDTAEAVPWSKSVLREARGAIAVENSDEEDKP